MGFDPNLLKAIDSISEQYIAVHDEIEQIWMEYMIFTWHWWLDVAFAVLPWILWFIVRDRKKTHSLMYAGFSAMLVSTLLCMIGVSQNAWSYNTLLLPYFPEYLPWDLTIMPVTAMLFYQFFPKFNPWLKGIVFGAVASYVVEPLLMWMGFYEPSNWEHHYSLPLYIIIYMIGYWLYSRREREVRA